MAFPPCRVLALPKATNSRPIEDVFNPPPETGRGFRLFCPYRLQHAQDEGGVDRSDRLRADGRARICRESVRPLLAMLRVAPRGFVCGDIGVAALIEGFRLGFRRSGTPARVLAFFDRIGAMFLKRAGFGCLLASLRERHVAECAEPHLPLLAHLWRHEAEEPRAADCTTRALSDLQIQAPAVGMHAGPGRPYLCGRQPIELHRGRPFYQRLYPRVT